MPSDVGTQSISIQFNMPANAAGFNKRDQNLKPIGIYSGGYVSYTGSSNVATISPLVCEISDGEYQIRAETTVAVNLNMLSTTPYIILRWNHNDAAADYMEILQKAYSDILANDLIIGKCTFSGSNINGILYNATDTYSSARGTLYYRSTPNDSSINLKVEAIASSMTVRVRAGRILLQGKYVYISDQVTSAFTAHATQNKIGLVYITNTGTIAIYDIHSGDGVAPNYGGKIVIAQVRITPAATTIVQAMIHDCRNTCAYIKAPEKYYQDAAPATRPDGTYFDTTDVGTIYINTTTKAMQVLTSADGAGTDVWTNVPIVYTIGDQTIAGIKIFSSFPVTPSSAPTTNYQVANKKYVDDKNLWQVGSALSPVTAAFANTWQDLDLSSIVGEKAAFILLKAQSADQIYMGVKQKGDTTDVSSFGDANQNGVNSCFLKGGLTYSSYLTVCTNSFGVIEWKASSTSTVTFTILGFITTG